MIFLSRKTDTPDIDTFEKHLNYRKSIYMDLAEMERRAQEYRVKQPTLKNILLRYMSERSCVRYNELTPKTVLQYLTETELIDIKAFSNKKNVSGVSIQKSTILEPLAEMGWATNFFNLYFECIHLDSLISTAKGFINRQSMNSTTKGNKGEELKEVFFKVNPQINLRYNYSAEALVNIEHEYTDCIAAPEGYAILNTDLKQGDMRVGLNLFLRTEEIDRILALHPEDVYEGLYHMVIEYKKKEIKRNLESMQAEVAETMKNGGEDLFYRGIIRDYKEKLKSLPQEEIPRFSKPEDRPPYKVDGLATLFSNRRSRNPNRQKFMSELGAIFDSIPEYRDTMEKTNTWKNYATHAIVESYFGHKETILMTQGYGINDPRFKMFNYPNQTGTSEIVIFFVNEVLKRCHEKGLIQGDIHIYINRHDEPVFLFRAEMVETIAPIVEDCRKIQIDDWNLIEFDEVRIGYNYKVPDKELMDRYHRASKEMEHTYKYYPKGENQHHSTLPQTKKICFEWFVDTAVTGEDYLVSCTLDLDIKQPYINKIAMRDKSIDLQTYKTALFKAATKRFLTGEYALVAVATTSYTAMNTTVNIDDLEQKYDSVLLAARIDHSVEEYSTLTQALVRQYSIENISKGEVEKEMPHNYLLKLKKFGYYPCE